VNKIKTASLIIILFGFIHSAKCQSFTDKLSIGGNFYYGFIIPHHSDMIHLTNRHFTMQEVNLTMQTNGNKLWHQLFNYPILGLSLLYSDLGNNPYLGNVISVMPTMNFNLTLKKKFNLYFRLGSGLGYLTKRFERLENYKNTVIGTHLNVAIQLMYEARWNITNRWTLNAGISLTHFSNGAFKTPNLGINITTLHLGASWKINKNPSEKILQTIPVINKKKIEFSFYALFGTKELNPPDGKKYLSYCFSTTIMKPLSIKRKLGLGIDVSVSYAYLESLKERGIEPSNDFQKLRPGVNISYKLDFSHLAMLMQVGCYLYTLQTKDGYIYDRFSFEYTFKKHYIIHLGLKSHFFTADLIELGVGYRI